MDLDPGTVAIIQLAWSRRLGLEDDALSAAVDEERIYDVQDEASEVKFVRLFGREVFSGPEWAAKQVRSKSTAELSSFSGLLRLSLDHGGRGMAEEHLYYTDSYPPIPVAEELAVADDYQYAEALERLCPPDDVVEAKLSGHDILFVLVDDTGPGTPVPLAGAGYTIREGILADVGTLTAPDHRMRGLGSYVTSIAVEDAMAAGLIPQSRIQSNNLGASRTAAGAGFVSAGLCTSVSLPA